MENIKSDYNNRFIFIKNIFIFDFLFSAENFCTPGSTFKQNCNMCICSKDGRVAACTDMACPEEMTNEIDSTPSGQLPILVISLDH